MSYFRWSPASAVHLFICYGLNIYNVNTFSNMFPNIIIDKDPPFSKMKHYSSVYSIADGSTEWAENSEG